MSEKNQPAWHKRGLMALISKRDNSDILGSYTGTDAEGEEPEQDADDL